MPQAVDEERMKELQSLDLAKPPLKFIDFQDFPRVVYFHPTRKFKQHSELDSFGNTVTTTVPTVHKEKKVENAEELKAALAAGWKKEQYIPAVLERPADEDYAEVPEKKK